MNILALKQYHFCICSLYLYMYDELRDQIKLIFNQLIKNTDTLWCDVIHRISESMLICSVRCQAHVMHVVNVICKRHQKDWLTSFDNPHVSCRCRNWWSTNELGNFSSVAFQGETQNRKKYGMKMCVRSAFDMSPLPIARQWSRWWPAGSNTNRIKANILHSGEKTMANKYTYILFVDWRDAWMNVRRVRLRLVFVAALYNE